MILWSIVVLVVVALVAVAFAYNWLVGTAQMANEAWSGIDVQLKRRAELVPNLVEVVKGYAAHERDTLEKLTQMRTAAQAVAKGDVAGRAQAEGALGAALGRVMAVAEGYPDLKASANFLELQRELSKLENDLQMARRYYNGAVRNLNTLVQKFPVNLIAGPLGFRQRAYFEVSAEAERSAPALSL